ncbi:unnamed protein product, partial [Heterosigma akashiwo]
RGSAAFGLSKLPSIITASRTHDGWQMLTPAMKEGTFEDGELLGLEDLGSNILKNTFDLISFSDEIASQNFEPQLDLGALTSLLVCAAVVAVFFIRLNSAITKAEAEKAIEKIEKEMSIKRLTGEEISNEVEEKLVDLRKKAQDTYIGPFR